MRVTSGSLVHPKMGVKFTLLHPWAHKYARVGLKSASYEPKDTKNYAQSGLKRAQMMLKLTLKVQQLHENAPHNDKTSQKSGEHSAMLFRIFRSRIPRQSQKLASILSYASRPFEISSVCRVAKMMKLNQTEKFALLIMSCRFQL